MAKTKKGLKPGDENAIHLTREAYEELEKELKNRSEVLRKEIADEISAARELGDLSENYGYTDAMEKKDFNENRIMEIENVLAVATISDDDAKSAKDSFVSVGEPVELLNLETDKKMIVTLVGSEESKAANPSDGKISVESPIGSAIFNAKIGDEVEVKLPTRMIKFRILRFVRK